MDSINYFNNFMSFGLTVSDTEQLVLPKIGFLVRWKVVVEPAYAVVNGNSFLQCFPSSNRVSSLDFTAVSHCNLFIHGYTNCAAHDWMIMTFPWVSLIGAHYRSALWLYVLNLRHSIESQQGKIIFRLRRKGILSSPTFFQVSSSLILYKGSDTSPSLSMGSVPSPHVFP